MKIVHDVIGRFGSPLQLHSDQGRNYESEIFKQIFERLGTSARNPKCNGMIERMNRTLLRMIRAYLRGEQQDWDLYLGCLAAAYRSTPNESTGFTPNMLMLGHEVRQPTEIIFGSENSENEQVTSYGYYVENLKLKMQKAHDVCRKHLMRSAKRMRDRYDAKKQMNTYNTGDAVWCLNERRTEGVCPKLQRLYMSG